MEHMDNTQQLTSDAIDSASISWVNGDGSTIGVDWRESYDGFDAAVMGGIPFTITDLENAASMEFDHARRGGFDVVSNTITFNLTDGRTIVSEAAG